MGYLKVGKIVNTFGIKGELKVKSYTDFDEERFSKGSKLFIKDQDYIEVEVLSSRYHKGMLMVLLKGLEDINLVEKYKECELYIDEKDIHKLEDGEYYFFELKDLNVYNMDNNLIGKVLKVEEGLAHNNLRIELLEGKTCLVPFVKAFIHKVDLENKKIWIKTIEGLL